MGCDPTLGHIILFHAFFFYTYLCFEIERLQDKAMGHYRSSRKWPTLFIIYMFLQMNYVLGCYFVSSQLLHFQC